MNTNKNISSNELTKVFFGNDKEKIQEIINNENFHIVNFEEEVIYFDVKHTFEIKNTEKEKLFKDNNSLQDIIESNDREVVSRYMNSDNFDSEEVVRTYIGEVSYKEQEKILNKDLNEFNYRITGREEANLEVTTIGEDISVTFNGIIVLNNKDFNDLEKDNDLIDEIFENSSNYADFDNGNVSEPYFDYENIESIDNRVEYSILHKQFTEYEPTDLIKKQMVEEYNLESPEEVEEKLIQLIKSSKNKKTNSYLK
jgi:hypothetical protein